jgi:hypothetical protein
MVSLDQQWRHRRRRIGYAANVSCQPCERSSSDQDMRSYFTASSIWQLPLGRGHALLSNSSRTTDLLLGGWQLSTIASARSGLPRNVTISRDTSSPPDQINNSERPDRIPGVPLYPAHRTPGNWLNPAPYQRTALGATSDETQSAPQGSGRSILHSKAFLCDGVNWRQFSRGSLQRS